jgi:hypothetical protein
LPPSITATQELVVPRSMPIIFPIVFNLQIQMVSDKPINYLITYLRAFFPGSSLIWWFILTIPGLLPPRP